MEKHRKVSGLISGSKAKCSVIDFVAAVCIHTPVVWTLWHDEKPSALTIRLLQRTKSPQKRIAGAENSVSENTSPTVEKALMLKSPPMKSTLCCFMWPCNRRRRSVEASRFLATTLWMCTEQNVTVGVPQSERRRSSKPRTMRRTIHQVPLLVESSLKAKTIGSGSKVSLLSKMARSVLSVCAMN